ncbi:hypothetical protein DVR12_17820 [Chitinophaga silvatica]|uniref:DUF6881 domain-containing protein n=1 Tax=Chitinophaga silvatica TaxID=2282649 RepID=A0A3E1Y814_9BACT|nr:hypothetical protein [Chitinophaga silvatica]RFS21192.1 hypothetical protein DVR12_17820 [Chitinophaga silvatica]
MKYIKVTWIHDVEDDPILFYSEIDSERYEVRKIEIYIDESFGLASQNFEFGGAALGEMPVPSLDEIAENTEFLPFEILKEEFEEAWNKYSNYLRLEEK